MHEAKPFEPPFPASPRPGGADRSVEVAVDLMRMALALLDRAGETGASILLCDAIVHLAGDPLDGAEEDVIVAALDGLRAHRRSR